MNANGILNDVMTDTTHIALTAPICHARADQAIGKSKENVAASIYINIPTLVF